MTTKSKGKAAPKAAPKAAQKVAVAAVAETAGKVEKAVETAREQAVEVAEAVQAQAVEAAEAVQSQAAEVAEAVQAQAVEAAEAVKAQAEKTGAAAAQGYDDLAALQKDGVEALIKAGEIMARGAEALGKEYFAFAQDAAAANGEAMKAVLSAKSIEEAVELQSEFVRANFDRSLHEGSKLSEMSIKIANEAFEPLQKQFNAAVELSMKPVAL